MEAKEQMSAQIGLFFILIFLLCIYLILAFRLKKRHHAKQTKLLFVGGFLMINAVLFFKMFALDKGKTTLPDKLDTAWRNTVNKYRKTYPSDLILSLFKVLSVERESRQLNKTLSSFLFDARQYPESSKNQTTILVIGETARYHNFHINGYERETTPYLDTVSNLISFSNMYSCGNITQISIPQIITRSTPENFDLQYKEKTVLDAFRESGFYTAWISSQDMDQPIIHRLKKVANYTFFPTADFDVKGFYDGSLLPKVQAILEKPNQPKKFIILHTLGSHFRYSSRYPQGFEKFKPTIATGGLAGLDVSPKDRDRLLNAYDNSILYTDYFLAQLIKMLRETNTASTLIYLSDHGESLYDNGQTLIFHGNEQPSEFEYHIPFLVWYSDQYAHTYPQKVTALQTNKNQRAMATATFYTLLDLDNIQYKGSDTGISKSLCNPKYKEPQKRTLLNSAHEILILK